MPTLQLDDFFETALPALTVSGFVFTLVQRHEPTVLHGTTPRGVAFTFRVDATGWSATYRNKTAGSGLPDPEWWTAPAIENRLRSVVTAAGG